MHDYHTEFLEHNENLYHVYLESHREMGGGRDVVFLRQHERGIPLTLRENFSENGTLTSATEQRDIMKVENEFQAISQAISYGKIVCLPMYPLTKEIITLEKQSLKLAGYIKKRMESLNLRMRLKK
jgi:hypothetical protein|tara:strand:+ start:35 stop:412 length:378 start_codon:yes stop_codon:yes gene_type:complete